jgi:hypothetical protein
LIASFDVEVKTQTNDGQSKLVKGRARANMVHQPHYNGNGGEGKGKNNKLKQTATFLKWKNKENKGCFMCDYCRGPIPQVSRADGYDPDESGYDPVPSNDKWLGN